jgi:hypothetical protein
MVELFLVIAGMRYFGHEVELVFVEEGVYVSDALLFCVEWWSLHILLGRLFVVLLY